MKELLKNKKFIWLIISLIVILPFLVLSYFDKHLFFWIELPIFLLMTGVIGYKIFYSGLKSLIKLKFSNINLLMTVAIAGAFYLRQFEEAVIIVILFSISENLEEFGIKRSQDSLKTLVEKSSKTAALKGRNENVPIENIGIGDTVIIKPGDIIPMDGIVTYGSSIVDESTITGEPVPKSKFLNSPVYSGTQNGTGYLEIEVTKKARDATLSKIIELTYKAAEKKTSSQKFIEKFAKYYTPTVLCIAILLVIIPVFAFRGQFNYWFTQALTLLIISCPCALVISTPVTIFSAIGNATRNGVLIKGGKYLEDMGKIKAIALDKTKTLTKGEPIVADIVTFNGYSRQDVLACAAGLESFSEHPIAKSILNKAAEEGIKVHDFSDFKSVTGKGVTGTCTVCEHKDILGNLSFIKEQLNIKLNEEIIKMVNEFEKQGKTVILLSENNSVSGIITITDKIRKESKQLIESIKNSGITPVILTGDNKASAEFIASHLGIEKVKAGLLPQNKVEEIDDLKKEYGYVAMLGDGVNDAPALTTASVGISMGAVGSDIAIENSDIALMNDNLLNILFTIRLGKKSNNVIKFNIISAIIVKFIFMVLALLGISNLSLAIIADVGLTIFVVINGLRLFKFK
ncbi:MAG: putative cadmium-transporting ATPase [Actinobacteria bacterium ADurb.Bin346]|nr:MAG: putative cadmium-transporting ATPase [Actinobacteria bacterium ADurb.Bin346]